MADYTAARAAYQEDVKRKPHYHDGAPRPAWDQLPAWARWTWARNPTPRTWN